MPDPIDLHKAVSAPLGHKLSPQIDHLGQKELCCKINEANEVEMFRTDEPKDRLLVRQISGAIARRIICEAKTDQTFAAGEKFGMIKFGSCTELFVPVRDNLECTTAVGNKVKAGLAILARYK